MKNKGITLIALIITIIVLLILAGVSIALVVGDNGIATKAQQSKVKTEVNEVKEAAEIIRGEYEVENDGNNPSSRYIIESLINQGKITASQVNDYGDETGIGNIVVQNEIVTIYGKSNREYRIFIQGEENELLPRFCVTTEPYLSPSVDVIMKMNSYNGTTESVKFWDGIYRSNESDIIDYAVEIKKSEDNIEVEKSHVHQDSRYWYDYWYCEDTEAINYFENLINNIRPHLYINNIEVNYDGIKLIGYIDGKNHFYIPFVNNNIVYALEASLGNDTSRSAEQFVIYNYGLYNGTTITSTESYDTVNVVLKYDDGRTFEKTSKEFVKVVYELLDQVVPHTR